MELIFFQVLVEFWICIWCSMSNIVCGETIIIQSQNLSSVPYEDIPQKVTHLHLGYSIRYIPARAFSNFTELQHLNLKDNIIDYIDPTAFGDLTKVEELDLTNNNLVNITQIVWPYSLTKLNLTGNNVQEIVSDVFADCVNLTVLYLNDNNIIRTHENTFKGLGQLKYLTMANNELTIIPHFHQDNQKMRNLYLDNNRIGQFNSEGLVHLVSLEYLWLSGNQLIFVGCLPELPRLIKLNLTYNKIQEMEFCGTTSSLAYVYLNGNSFKHLPRFLAVETSLLYIKMGRNNIDILNETIQFQYLPKLQSISFDGNGLWMVEVAPCIPTTIHLYLNDNLLTIIDMMILARCSNVSHAHFENNKLVHINQFPYLPKLTELYLFANQIETLDPDALLQLPMLEILRLDGNKLQICPNISAQANSLIHLYLQTNKMIYLNDSCFEGMVKLMILNLDNNDLHAELNLPIITSIHSIYLSNNKMGTIPCEALRRISNVVLLDLNKNNMTIFCEDTTIILPKLETLILVSNKLEENLVLPPFPKLKILNIAHNNIGAIMQRSLHGMPMLSIFNGEDNNFTEIPSFSLCKCLSLTHLFFANNKIIYLRHASLSGLSKLQFISLNGNHLSTLPDLHAMVMPSDSLVVEVLRCPLVCNISICWEKDSMTSQVIVNSGVCVKPTEMIGQKLESLDKYTLGCYGKNIIYSTTRKKSNKYALTVKLS